VSVEEDKSTSRSVCEKKPDKYEGVKLLTALWVSSKNLKAIFNQIQQVQGRCEEVIAWKSSNAFSICLEAGIYRNSIL